MTTLVEAREQIAQRDLDYWHLYTRNHIQLDGDFSLDDLEHIVACMRELEEEQ